MASICLATGGGWGWTTAAAPPVVDLGVTTSTDAVTGERTCSQVVFHAPDDPTGVSPLASTSDAGRAFAMLVARKIGDRPATFDPSSGVGPFDGVTVHFRDGSSTWTPSSVHVDEPLGLELAVVAVGLPAVRAFLRQRDPLDVTFEGGHGVRDFTVRADVFAALRNGFAVQCLTDQEAWNLSPR